MNFRNDNPAVTVMSGNLDRAIRFLNIRIGNGGGIFKTLRFRNEHPAPAARRRAKRKLAWVKATSVDPGGVKSPQPLPN